MKYYVTVLNPLMGAKTSEVSDGHNKKIRDAVKHMKKHKLDTLEYSYAEDDGYETKIILSVVEFKVKKAGQEIEYARAA